MPFPTRWRVTKGRSRQGKGVGHFLPEGAENPKYPKLQVAGVFKDLEAKIVRWNILDTGNRIDGRDVKTVRPIVCELACCRAPTVLRCSPAARPKRSSCNARYRRDEQWIDALQGTYKNRSCCITTSRRFRLVRPPRRRTGSPRNRTRQARLALDPSRSADKAEFPYTIRVVSEITESNGSSSMATVCGTSLALMDAGVPLKRPTAGIAMGLIKEEERFAVLSDILGDEDHLGDMDFKVAGTDNGVTSLQMDIKIAGITEEIMRIALGQAKDAACTF